jgi:hypothetical protein
MNTNPVYGLNENAQRGDNNAPLQWPVTLAPIPLPLNNLWSEDAKVGSILFYRQMSEQIIRHIPMGISPSTLQKFVGANQIECMDVVRVNYLLQTEAQKDPSYKLNLKDYYEEFRVGGRLTQTLVPATTKETNKRARLSDYKVGSLMIRGETTIDNYWGSHVSGDGNCHLFFVLKYLPVDPETVYHTNVAGNEARVLDDKFEIEDDLMRRLRNAQVDIVEFSRMRYKPEWVAVAHTSSVLPFEKRMFEVKGWKQGETFTGEGWPVYVGRCTRNLRFDPVSARDKNIPHTLCRNMQNVTRRGTIDVLLGIREHLMC